MVTQIDDKGKIFTQVVPKQPVEVIIRTKEQNIRGILHVRQGLRMKDELNGQDHFIAITDAIIMDNANNVLYQTSFMILNTEHIIWIVPQECLVQ